jgi:hypothetical protein
MAFSPDGPHFQSEFRGAAKVHVQRNSRHGFVQHRGSKDSLAGDLDRSHHASTSGIRIVTNVVAVHADDCRKTLARTRQVHRYRPRGGVDTSLVWRVRNAKDVTLDLVLQYGTGGLVNDQIALPQSNLCLTRELRCHPLLRISLR